MDWLVISAQTCIWCLAVGDVRAGPASFSCEETRTWKSSGTICQLSKGCFGSHLVMGVAGRQICVSDGFAARFFAGVSLVHYLLFSKGKIRKHRTIPWAFLFKTIKLRTRQPPSSTNSDSCVLLKGHHRLERGSPRTGCWAGGLGVRGLGPASGIQIGKVPIIHFTNEKPKTVINVLKDSRVPASSARYF